MPRIAAPLLRNTWIILALCLALLRPAAPCLAQTPPAFKHIIIVVQENRTPDNLFGSNPTFEPGVDLATSGENSSRKTIPLEAVPLAGCYDLSHQNSAFRQMYNDGKMNGADHITVSIMKSCALPGNPQFKYVDNASGTVQPYFDIARAFGFANRMFQTNQGPSFPAHQFLFGATSAPSGKSRLFAAENMTVGTTPAGVGCTAELGQTVVVIGPAGSEASSPPVYPCFTRETMADLLDRAGVSWEYYVDSPDPVGIWNAPLAIDGICVPKVRKGVRVCTGAEYAAHVTTVQAQVLTDIEKCKLPGVSWVIPNAANSDHAAVNNGTGPSWVASIVNAVGTQAACAGGENYWNDTAILITWDDWGGWYDHVPPFRANGWPNENWGAGYIYGFRVPLLVVSAYTPAGFVYDGIVDFGSLLQFTERNFGLGSIGPGYWADAHGGSLDPFFTLTSPRSFVKIPSALPAAYFLHVERSTAPVDDDD